jgi:hypothetical protein
MSEAIADASASAPESAESGLVAATLTERIRERPLLSVGLAGLAGFVIGGGATSRTGAATLMFIARIWLKSATTEAVASAMTSYGTTKRNGSA